MTLTTLLLLSSVLAFPQHGRIPRNYKPVTAEWNGTKWTCPNNLRLPPGDPKWKEQGGFPPPQKDEPVPPCISPPPQPPRPVFNDSEPHGIWAAPETPSDILYESIFGVPPWKHYKVQYMPLRGRLYRVCQIQNMTHWLPYYFDHDPKNLVLTRTSFEFDARAGDMIEWRICSGG